MDTVDLSLLVKKLSLMSVMMRYYGYLHECAELFRQLCRGSRQLWDSNLKPITQVIMSNDINKMYLVGKEPFSEELAEALLKYNTYLYYSLEITVKSNDHGDALIGFINRIDLHPRDLFHDVRVHYQNGDYWNNSLGKFFNLYLEKGFIRKNVYLINFEQFSSDLFFEYSPDGIYMRPEVFYSFYEFLEVYEKDLSPFKKELYEYKRDTFCKNLTIGQKESLLRRANDFPLK